MRIIVVSDVHGNNDAFNAVLSQLGAYDRLICLGDIVGYGPEPNEVVETIRKIRPDVIIMGNHDQAVVTGDVSEFNQHAALAVEWTRKILRPDNLAFLSRLNPSAKFTVGKLSMAAYHGSPRDPINEYVYPDAPRYVYDALLEMSGSQVLLLGHTHMPFTYKTAKGILINPGSIGQPRDGDPRAAYLCMKITDNQIETEIIRREYDIHRVAEKIRKNSLPNFLAERLFLGI